MVTSNKKTYTRYTKNKEQKNQLCHQRKLPSLKARRREGGRKEGKDQKTNSTRAGLSTYLSIKTLNINKLNSSIES